MSFLKRVTLLSVLVLACLPAFAGAQATTRLPSGGTVEVIVTLDAKPLARGGNLRTLEATQRSAESELTDRIEGLSVQHRYSTVLDALAVTLPASELEAVESTDGVVRVYPNVAYRALRSSSPAFIGAPALWGQTLSSAGNGVKIGIIDDGLDKTHPYFSARGYRMPRGFPKGQKSLTSAKVIVARAFAPRTPKWKYSKRAFDPLNSDHATHVAGIAAGNHRTQASGSRISGVAPKAYLGNYKVLTVPSGFGLNGNSAEIVAGIEAAVRDGMDVINLSLGEAEIEPSRDIVAAALDGAAAAGVVPVVAAGNNFEELGAGSVTSPGSSDRAITVAAESEAGGAVVAPFSSGGPTPYSLRMKPDVTAPGVSVLSSVPRREGLWAEFSGTSMAAPHVAGAAALLHQRHPSWTVAQIKSALVQTGQPVLRGAVEAESTRRRRRDRRPRPRRRAAALRVADRSLVRPRRAGRVSRGTGDAHGCRWRHRAMGGRDDAPAAGRRRLVQRSAGHRAGRARRDGERGTRLHPGQPHRVRRAHARHGSSADPLLAPRLRAGPSRCAHDASQAHGHVQGQHPRATGAGRVVPLPRGSPRPRRPARPVRARSRCSGSR